MPKLTTIRALNLRDEAGDVWVFRTFSKKGKFTCSEAKLYHSLLSAVRQVHLNATVSLCTMPTVSVIVHLGGASDEYSKPMYEAVKSCLLSNHDGGARYVKKYVSVDWTCSAP